MMMIVVLLALTAPPGPEGLPKSLQEDEGPHPPGGFRPVEREEESDPVESFSIDFVFQLRSIGGTTKVREFDYVPARLNLAEDLGFGNAGVGRVSFRWDTAQFRWFVEAEFFYGTGKGQTTEDFVYDEGFFKGGIPFETHTAVFFARSGVALRGLLPDAVAGGWIAPLIGLEYPRMSVGIDQPLANEGTSEQYEQFIPYPILGLVASIPIGPTLTLDARAFGSWVPKVPTPFTEGGRMHMEIATYNVEANLVWRLTPAIRLTGGVGYQYWHGILTSGEDGNDLKIKSPYLEIGVEFRW